MEINEMTPAQINAEYDEMIASVTGCGPDHKALRDMYEDERKKTLEFLFGDVEA